VNTDGRTDFYIVGKGLATSRLGVWPVSEGHRMVFQTGGTQYMVKAVVWDWTSPNEPVQRIYMAALTMPAASRDRGRRYMADDHHEYGLNDLEEEKEP
jgi:hypothetical protein